MSLRRPPWRQWSLSDSYGFIATLVGSRTRMRTRPRLIRYLSNTRNVNSAPPATVNNASASSSTASAEDQQQNVSSSTQPPSAPPASHTIRRGFHNYFVTHLPSSSLHPDSRLRAGPHHKLPRSAAAPHVAGPGSSPAASPPHLPMNRDLTVVRIPLRSAKHHFGVAESRGQRIYNEDTNQAGTMDMPAFAKQAPISLVRSEVKRNGEGTPADSAFGDPQVFYFGVFDGHGGAQASEFLRDELHGYVEEAAEEFELKSSLRWSKSNNQRKPEWKPEDQKDQKDYHQIAPTVLGQTVTSGAEQLKNVDMKHGKEVSDKAEIPETNEFGAIQDIPKSDAISGEKPVAAKVNEPKALRLQRELVQEYKNTVGGYFRRFHPPHFPEFREDYRLKEPSGSIESVLTYAFLRADLDFITAQARKPDPDDAYVTDSALNHDEVLGSPYHMPPSGHGIGGRTRFKGGSTASIALISTPTPAPFWHPASTSTLIVAHVGDSRIVLCSTATGLAKPLTSDHHPGSPTESHRLRRYSASFVTDSFGEERIQGLANSRSFGDIGSKRLGVSAEPEVTRVEMGPAMYSFLVLMSDGVSGSLSDQEIVDVVKEASTPEQGARDVVAYSTEVTHDGDNATCLVVRLGGWERRSEGGLGSLGTKELRDYRRAEAMDPRRRRR